MWREYTREVPARRGLTFVASALALAGSIALAQILVSDQPGLSTQLTRHHPAEWPISVALPGQFVEVIDSMELSEPVDDESASVLFHDPNGSGVILIRYRLEERQESSADVLGEIIRQGIPGRSLSMGIAAGEYVMFETADRTMFVAAAAAREGLVIQFRYMSSSRPMSPRMLREICDTIRWEPWWVGKPSRVR